jgi:hypothetical protein
MMMMMMIIIIINAEQKLIKTECRTKAKKTEDIKIECGIFQVDSLSPLLFCNSAFV